MVPPLVTNESPIFFLRMGKSEAMFAAARRLEEEGHYVNVSHFPAVPTKRAGLRIALSALHSDAEVRALADSLVRHVPEVLARHGTSPADLDELYAQAVPKESWGHVLNLPSAHVPTQAARLPDGCTLQVAECIEEVPQTEWDAVMDGHGASSWAALRSAERLFRDHPAPEHRWDFRYLLVRDTEGEVAAATYLTHCLNKEDMLARVEVSRAVEERRQSEPYFLCSPIVMMGSHLSEGEHLFLVRRPGWEQVLDCILEEALRWARQTDASAVVLREFGSGDPEMEAFMARRDFLVAEGRDTFRLTMKGTSEASMIEGAGRRTRRFLKALSDASSSYQVQLLDPARAPVPEPLRDHLHALYRDLAATHFEINIFAFPRELIDALLDSPAWEVVALTLPDQAGGPEHGMPVAWFAAHRSPRAYSAFLCGVDRAFVQGTQFGAYRQMLLAITRRARAVGAARVDLGMGAGVEKSRLGALPHPTRAYVRAVHHDYGEELRFFSSTIGAA
jgi:hypothetical protein